MKSTGHHVGSRRRRTTTALIALVATVALGACQPLTKTVTPNFRRSIITDSGEVYRYREVSRTSVTVTGPSKFVDGNQREAMVATNAPLSVDQQACVTWHGPASGHVQPGVVLRSLDDEYRTRLIMVTNNVYVGYRWGVNVHLVDTHPDPKKPYRQIASYTSTAIGYWQTTQPLPWRFCARVIGTRLQVKAWTPAVNAEPSWDSPDQNQVLNTTVPPSYVYAGRPGIYVGHLPKDVATRFTDIATQDLTTPR